MMINKENRKISNQLDYIKNLFNSVHPKHSMIIDERNEIYYNGDLAISLNRNGNILLLTYNEVKDIYEVLHKNIMNNSKGKHKYHKHDSSSQLPVVIRNIITLHFDYSKSIKNKTSIEKAFDKIK